MAHQRHIHCFGEMVDDDELIPFSSSPMDMPIAIKHSRDNTLLIIYACMIEHHHMCVYVYVCMCCVMCSVVRIRIESCI